MSKQKVITNSAKCEGCIHCLIVKQNNLDYVHCNSREKSWMFGQNIDPCKDYKKEVQKKNADC